MDFSKKLSMSSQQSTMAESQTILNIGIARDIQTSTYDKLAMINTHPNDGNMCTCHPFSYLSTKMFLYL
jgi:hypothetical protein